MSTLPTLREMLDNGVHFGHITSRWNPKMKPFIYASRDNVHVINLEQTRKQLEQAVKFLQSTVEKGGTVLFVGTKRQVKDLVKQTATQSGMPYMTERWFGGALTNFSILRRNVKLLEDMEKAEAEDALGHLTKKERLVLDEKKRKLAEVLDGIRGMARLPQAVIVIDAQKEHIAVTEATTLNIPVVAVIDTNTNPGLVDYPIPANDDAVKSVKLLLDVMKEAIVEARANRQPEQAEETPEQKA